MKKLIFLFVILFVLILATALSQNYVKTGHLPFAANEKSPTAAINKQRFKLLIAKTSLEKEIGLSKKDSLNKDSGMLFLFDSKDYYAFWARDMRFPIDVIYINKDKIVTIYKDVKPQKDQSKLPILKPKQPADKVLEINAGLSEKYKFKEGDPVKIENPQ